MAVNHQYLVRPAQPSDADSVTGLLAMLGYPDKVPHVRDRLERLTARQDAGVLVADVGGTVSAVAAYQVTDLLERRQPQCRITALVVDAAARRHGLARALMARIEAIADQYGCFRLEVTTQPQRPEATAVYLALGFHERPRRLVKALVSA